jgi:8-oxo-dGTP pyrophosphatase MutT (NUDIX family)
MTTCTLDAVRAALALPGFDGEAAQLLMAPSLRPRQRPATLATTPRLGGVLLLLYCADDELMLVLTLRPTYEGVHSGQVSCPGGRHEPPETLEMTALRETEEEIGVPPANVTILGPLTPLYIMPSDYEVHPFVGFHAAGRPLFVSHPREVAAIIETPLRLLLDPATRREEEWELRGLQMTVPFFQVGEHKVWGATAMMLSEFVERLRAAPKARSRTAVD